MTDLEMISSFNFYLRLKELAKANNINMDLCFYQFENKSVVNIRSAPANEVGIGFKITIFNGGIGKLYTDGAFKTILSPIHDIIKQITDIEVTEEFNPNNNPQRKLRWNIKI